MANDNGMKIRDAVPEYTPAACLRMRRAIAKLRVAARRNDRAILHRWLRSKTPDIFKSWIRPDNALLVAVESDRILAVGCVTGAREITLNSFRRMQGFAVSVQPCWGFSKNARWHETILFARSRVPTRAAVLPRQRV